MRPGLGFALLCASTVLACSDDGPPPSQTGSTDDTTGTTTAPTTSTTSTDSASGGSEGDGTSTTAASTTGGSSSSSGSADTSTGETGSESSGSGSTTGQGVAACEQGCATEFACGTQWTTEQECVIACEANLVKAGLFSIPCQAAWEDLAVCLGTLTCEEFVQWQSPMAFPYPCSESDVLLEIECEGQ